MSPPTGDRRVEPEPASARFSRRVHRRAFWSRVLTGGSPRPSPHELRQIRRGTRRMSPLWIVRQILGWIVIAIGIAGIVLPLLPAVAILPFGVWIVGRRSVLVRYTRTRMKLLLRVAETWPGWRGRVGRWLRVHERQLATRLLARRLSRLQRRGPSAASAKENGLC